MRNVLSMLMTTSRSGDLGPSVLHCGHWTIPTRNTLVACQPGPKGLRDYLYMTTGAQVLIKMWKDGSPKTQLQPIWKGSYPVILSSPTAVKYQDMTPGYTTLESSHGREKIYPVYLQALGRSSVSIQIYI